MDISSGKYEADFNDFFECFVRGEIPFGDYFDHISDWYDARDDPTTKVLFYEQMMDNPNRSIVALADFLHVTVTPQDVMVGLVGQMDRNCLFLYLTKKKTN